MFIFIYFYIITLGQLSFKGLFWDFEKYSFKGNLPFKNFDLDSKDSLGSPKQRVYIKNLIFDPIHAKKSANILLIVLMHILIIQPPRNSAYIFEKRSKGVWMNEWMKVYSETKKKHKNKVILINIFVSKRLLSHSCDVGT